MRRVEEQWGTAISIDVRDDVDPSALDECYQWFARVDDLFSTWRDDTAIMRIARGDLAPDDAPAEVRIVLGLCERLRQETGGAFDITAGAHPGAPARPGRAPIDPSGLVKGWAIARAGDLLRAAGASNFFVNAGGDVVVSGRPDPDAAGWRVGIQHPWERERVAAVVVVSDGAVATSGRYERGDHVLDPRTGLPATGLASVTVVGPDAARADAYATAIMVLGRDDGMRWAAGRAGYETLAITDDGRMLSTPGFAAYRAS